MSSTTRSGWRRSELAFASVAVSAVSAWEPWPPSLVRSVRTIAGSSYTTSSPAPVSSARGALAAMRTDRQREHDPCAFAHVLIDPDRSGVCFDEPFGDGEAESDAARALTGSSDPHERREDALRVGRSDTRSVVADFELHVAVVASNADADLGARR